jgi:diguanylate cyclase
MGTGIWSMHFIGMLAFHLPIPMAFDPVVTIASMLIAIVVSGFALFTASRRTLTSRGLVLAGTAMGIGIAAMHYTGMAALKIDPAIAIDWPVFAASIGIAIAASYAALWLASQLRSEATSYAVWKKLGSAMIMAAAIAGMHYTGMAAANFDPNTICTAPSEQVNSLWLAVLIAGCSAFFLAATMGIALFDASTARRLAIANKKISELAQTDALTTLTNRRAFHAKLAQLVAAAERGGNPFALLYLDLDGFKDINDTLGHPAGDLLLVEVADRLQNAVRDTDLVARFGGDEFAILQTNITDSSAIGTLAAKIGRLLAAPYSIGPHEAHITVSIGISAYLSEVKKPEEMMKRADLALYRAKNEGRNCFRFYSVDLDQEVHERIKLGEELQGAHERGELELHYRPEVETATGRIIALETVVRWNHPRLGVLLQPDLMSVAEKTRSIVPLSNWILNDACRQFGLWRDDGIAPQIIAVHISAAQFNRPFDVERDIADLLAKWQITPSCIELVFTEATLIEMAGKHDEVLKHLRELGLRFAIDEFGTGLSSLDYLVRLAPNRLKVAQKLVREITADPRLTVVVRAAIDVAHALGVEVVAEGIESEVQAKILISIGCAYGHGNYYGVPVAAVDTSQRLRRGVIRAARKFPSASDRWPSTFVSGDKATDASEESQDLIHPG